MHEIIISKIYLILLSTLVYYETFKYIIKLTVKQKRCLRWVVFSLLPFWDPTLGGETFSRGGFVSRPTKTFKMKYQTIKFIPTYLHGLGGRFTGSSFETLIGSQK